MLQIIQFPSTYKNQFLHAHEKNSTTVSDLINFYITLSCCLDNKEMKVYDMRVIICWKLYRPYIAFGCDRPQL